MAEKIKTPEGAEEFIRETVAYYASLAPENKRTSISVLTALVGVPSTIDLVRNHRPELSIAASYLQAALLYANKFNEPVSYTEIGKLLYDAMNPIHDRNKDLKHRVALANSGRKRVAIALGLLQDAS